MVLGGVQTGGVITQNTQTVGCNQQGGCPTNGPKADLISPEQAIYNVLTVYFDGTPVGSYYGLPPIVSSNLPLNYLQLYGSDVDYASTNITGTNIVDGSSNTIMVTAQSELNTASQQIAQIAELGLNVQAVGQTLQIIWLASVAASQLQVNHKLSDTNGWKQDTDVPTLTNIFYEISINPTADQSFFRLSTP